MKVDFSRMNANERCKNAFLLTVTAFILIQIFYLITGDVTSLFQTLTISIETLPVECFFLFLLAVFIYFMNAYWMKRNPIHLLCVAWSLYLAILSMISSSASISFGAILLQIPVLCVELRWWSRTRQNGSILAKAFFAFILIDTVYLIIRNLSLLPFQNIGKEKALFIGALYAIIAITIFALVNGIEMSNKKRKCLQWVQILIPISLFFFMLMNLIEIMYVRTISLSTPTYDMGLFSQMFHSMSEGNGPITTLERDEVLSHFSVHISPIYYLMLPFYMLWPKPETLQILQVFIVASGLIPFLLIAKHLKLSKLGMGISICLYCVAPGLLGSSLYDLHENCFLAPCLLWVIYFILKNKTIGLLVFTVLTLAIKEDAALYLCVVGLYFILQNRFVFTKKEKIRTGILLIAIPILYFSVAIFYLNHYGSGAMIGRFDNLIAYKDLGLLSIPITFFQNLTFIIASMFSPTKIAYIFLILGSVGFLPLVQKTFREYILLIPFIVMNLLSNYRYQFDIHFQYHYGSSVLLLFMVLLAIDGLKNETYLQSQAMSSTRGNSKKIISKSIVAIAIGAVFFGLAQSMSILQKYENAQSQYFQNQESIMTIKEALAQIPEEDSVLASGYLTTYLSNRDKIYDAQYHNKGDVDTSIDWVVIDKRWTSEHLQNLENAYISAGYCASSLSNEFVIILQRTN